MSPLVVARLTPSGVPRLCAPASRRVCLCHHDSGWSLDRPPVIVPLGTTAGSALVHVSIYDRGKMHLRRPVLLFAIVLGLAAVAGGVANRHSMRHARSASPPPAAARGVPRTAATLIFDTARP